MKTQKVKATEKFGGAATKPKNKYEALIQEALAIQDTIAGIEKKIKPYTEEIKLQSERLEQIKEEFRKKFGTAENKATMVTDSGTAEMKTANNYSVDAENIPVLEKIFKDNLGNFVTDKITYGITPAFKQLLADGDYPKIDKIRNAVSIKQTCNVKFFPFQKN